MSISRWLAFCLLGWTFRGIGRDIDTSMAAARTLDTPRTITSVSHPEEWKSVAQRIRGDILIGCGLEPMPPRTPLKTKIISHLDRDGYTVDILQFQPFPGVYVAGNLYRPKGPAGKRYPGVLNPHGHWDQGRLEQTETLDAPARCAQFAQMGMVALSYDMLGYQDTLQFDPIRPDENPDKPKFYDHHVSLFRDPSLQLWNMSLMGVQLWNSIRALDLLLSFPEVDPERIGCTGESGGGTQTFLLGAIDDRIRVSAPVNMVSHTMQGGCRCENAPGLRVEFSNLDFAAAFAPRPLLLVGATGDWTKDMLEVEGPAVGGIYQVLGAADRVHAVRFQARHNYNLSSREAVYAWFNRWLLGGPPMERFAEIANPHEPRTNLKLPVHYQTPTDALNEAAFVSAWIAERRATVESLKPTDRESLQRIEERAEKFYSYWWPTTEMSIANSLSGATGRASTTGDRPPGIRAVAILVSTNQLTDSAQSAIIEPLGKNGFAVEELEPYQTGMKRNSEICSQSPFTNFFNTYNRTILERRVIDIQNACQEARKKYGVESVVLIGSGEAGLWCLLAAPSASAVIADGKSLVRSEGSEWLTPERFLPGFNLFGGVEMSATLAAKHPLWLYGLPPDLATEQIKAAARISGTQNLLRLSSNEPLETKQLVDWMSAVAAQRP